MTGGPTGHGPAHDLVTVIDGSTLCISDRGGGHPARAPAGAVRAGYPVALALELRIGGVPPEPLTVQTKEPYAAMFIGRAVVLDIIGLRPGHHRSWRPRLLAPLPPGGALEELPLSRDCPGASGCQWPSTVTCSPCIPDRSGLLPQGIGEDSQLAGHSSDQARKTPHLGTTTTRPASSLSACRTLATVPREHS
jgi:hypothetical protein